MPKRTQIKGMGADAFFTDPTPLAPTTTQAADDESDEGGESGAGKTGNKEAISGTPRDVENGNKVRNEISTNFDENSREPNTVLPVSQQASTAVRQHASKTASQQASKTTKRELVKATFYLEPGHITMLEEMRLAERKKRGKGIDKSELVRRAIELLAKQ